MVNIIKVSQMDLENIFGKTEIFMRVILSMVHEKERDYFIKLMVRNTKVNSKTI